AAAPASTASALPGAARLIGLALGVVVLVWVVGSGWASTLLGRWLRPFELIAVAPAIGLAIIVLVGVALAPLGVRPGGVGAVVIAGIAALGGAVVPFRRRRRGIGGEGGIRTPEGLTTQPV